MRVLVTGASGFLGGHIVDHFLKNTDWDIVAVAAKRKHPLRFESDVGRVKTVFGDLNWNMPARILHGVDYIINVASGSEVSDSLSDPQNFIHNNVMTTTNMLEAARGMHDLRGFIQISTGEVYGPADLGVDHHEWSPIVTHSPYSASKAAQEAIACAYWKSYGVPVIIANTMNVFGERQSEKKFIPLVVDAIKNRRPVTIHGTPSRITTRRYIHARNVADGILHIMRTRICSIPGCYVPPKYNIVGDVEVNNLQLAERIAKIMGAELSVTLTPPDRPGHDSRYSLDGTKMKSFGWRAPVSFQDSLESTVRALML